MCWGRVAVLVCASMVLLLASSFAVFSCSAASFLAAFCCSAASFLAAFSCSAASFLVAFSFSANDFLTAFSRSAARFAATTCIFLSSCGVRLSLLNMLDCDCNCCVFVCSPSGSMLISEELTESANNLCCPLCATSGDRPASACASFAQAAACTFTAARLCPAPSPLSNVPV